MQKNYNQKELRAEIKKEYIDDKTFYYNLAKKEQKNFSIFKNDRLLVLDFQQGRLFYVNETKNLPFKNITPKPKNEYATLSETKIRHLKNTNEISFVFKYNNQQYVWIFIFQTNDVADEWMKLFQFQKESQQTKEKDFKALNKAIFQMPRIQQERADDIVKEPQRNIPDDQAKIINQKREISRSRQQGSSDYNRNKKITYSDWNQRFYKFRDLKTLFQFKKVAVDSFYTCLSKEPINSKGLRSYSTQSCIVKIANRFTPQAKKLKNEYRNYHFITQATNKEFIVGVPLSCLVEFQQFVSLVKARFPQRVEKVNYETAMKEHFNELQRYTRIKNKVLQQKPFLNLAPHYQEDLDYLIFLDDIFDYLPNNLQFPNQETLVRPQFMLDSVDYFIYSSVLDNKIINQPDSRQIRQLTYKITEKVNSFSQKFYQKQFPICRISELKDILHQAGLNLKYLPHIYSSCPNPQIKKHLYSAMTVKIVKDYIFENLIKIRENDPNAKFEKIFQQTIGIFLSGNNNRSHELWKQISLLFKKKYNILLNNKDLISGFFFNSILQLIPANYDVKKINKKKKIFEETKIIEPDFVKSLLPKVKCFHRFLTPYLQKLKNNAKQQIKSDQVCRNIMSELFNQKTKTYQSYYEFGRNDEWMLSYLSLYYPPQNIASEKQTKIQYLFDRINEQPPSNYTLTLTKNYLEWCIKKEDIDQFKKVFQVAIGISDFWLDQLHPMRSDLLQILSDYYSIQAMNEEMIKYMKDSLLIANKFWGQSSAQTGLKLYQLADRYLRICKKKEAIQYFHKARQNMQQNKTKTNKLGLTYMKMASIYLSDLQYQKAIEYAQASNKSFEDYQRKVNSSGIYNQPYKIKAYQVLARVYQICDKRSDYKDLALNCARKFNNTKNEEVFEQMIRICLASVVFKSNIERCESFLRLSENLDQEIQGSQINKKVNPINELIKMSQQIMVMQKFIYKYEFMERSLFELNPNPKKKMNLGDEANEFLTILRHIIRVVGIEYIKGLIQEKISYGN